MATSRGLGNGGQGSKWISRATRLAIYLRDGMACVYCGGGVESGVRLTLDHCLSRSRGGSNDPTNLVTACGPCNSKREDTAMAVWVRACEAHQGASDGGIAARVRRCRERRLPRDMARGMLAARSWSAALDVATGVVVDAVEAPLVTPAPDATNYQVVYGHDAAELEAAQRAADRYPTSGLGEDDRGNW